MIIQLKNYLEVPHPLTRPTYAVITRPDQHGIYHAHLVQNTFCQLKLSFPLEALCAMAVDDLWPFARTSTKGLSGTSYSFRKDLEKPEGVTLVCSCDKQCPTTIALWALFSVMPRVELMDTDYLQATYRRAIQLAVNKARELTCTTGLLK